VRMGGPFYENSPVRWVRIMLILRNE
jgi:hypothetical protein